MSTTFFADCLYMNALDVHRLRLRFQASIGLRNITPVIMQLLSLLIWNLLPSNATCKVQGVLSYA